MLEKLRSTLVYKLCGYTAYAYVIFIALYYLFMNITPGSARGIFFVFIPLIVLGVPILITLIFISLIIAFLVSRNKDMEIKPKKAADIGNVINVIFLLIAIGLLPQITAVAEAYLCMLLQ